MQATGGTGDTKKGRGALAALVIGGLRPEIMRGVPDWIEVERGEYPEDNPRGPAASAGG